MRRKRGAKFMRKKLILIPVPWRCWRQRRLPPLSPKGDEPVAVPRTIKQGIDFVYVDPRMSSVARRKQRPQNWLQRLFNPNASRRSGAPNPMFAELARGLQQYQATWGRLPQGKIPAGASLKRGSSGKRVELLRTRLGLPAGGGYDEQLFQTVTNYQRVHGLGAADGMAGKATISSLNRGAIYYARRIAINMERAYRLPPTRTFDRYVVVNSGAAEAYLFDRDRIDGQDARDRGHCEDQDADDGVMMRNAKANPIGTYRRKWSAASRRSGREQGLSYFKGFHYEVWSDWTEMAKQWTRKRSTGRGLPRARSADHPRPSASRAVEFDAQHEVRDAQRLWHLPARHAAPGAVRKAGPVAQ